MIYWATLLKQPLVLGNICIKFQVLTFKKLLIKYTYSLRLLLTGLIAINIFSINAIFGQDIFEPDSVKKTIEATPIQGSLKIDGLLQEEEWQKTKPVAQFTQVEPYQGKPVNFDTEVKMLYNPDFLYIAAFCKDSLGKKSIRVSNFQRDFE